LRCDLLPWAGLVGLHMLAARQISLSRGLATGAAAALGSVALSVALDSLFWRRWLWPEGEVLWFNTAENRRVQTLPLKQAGCSLDLPVHAPLRLPSAGAA
jgi:alpha-1,6-mannosyltransferase